jgi:A/G-specific adenine glycosylase
MLETEQKLISRWYLQNHRQLPWRQIKDAYKIWVSEIILQQTRVRQGLPYYQRFIAHFPDVASLAAAHEQDILHLWQGLGYYSRARNMHTAAKEIMKKHRGKFPDTYQEIRNLKGIGDYTAAAIASFAFGLPHVAVDGNVLRVISRIAEIEEDINLGKTRMLISRIAREMMGNSDPALFNQSMMEFGAMQCVAKNPQCDICPLRDRCKAFISGKVQHLPLKINKTKVRNRYIDYLIFQNKEHTYIKRRGKDDIWEGLYDFPLLEHHKSINHTDLIEQVRNEYRISKSINLLHRSKEFRHRLSHQLLHIHFNIIEGIPDSIDGNWIKVRFANLPDFPFPEIINKYKSKNNLFNLIDSK